MIQGDFHRIMSPQTVHFFSSEFRFVVETLDNSAGERFRLDGPNFIDRLAHMGHDVESIEHMHSLAFSATTFK